MVETLYLFREGSGPEPYTDFVHVYRHLRPDAIVVLDGEEFEYIDTMQLLCGKTKRIILFKDFHDEVWDRVNSSRGEKKTIRELIDNVASTLFDFDRYMHTPYGDLMVKKMPREKQTHLKGDKSIFLV